MVSPVDKSLGTVAFPTNVGGYSSGQQVLQAASPDGETGYVRLLRGLRRSGEAE